MKRISLLSFLFFCGFFSSNCCAQTWDWGISNNADYEGVVESSPTAVDRHGNVFCAGMMFLADSISFGSIHILDTGHYHQILVIKADSTGAIQWVVHTDSSFGQPVSIAADGVGNLYVLGTYFGGDCHIGGFTLSNPTGTLSYFIFKLSPGGTVLWAQNISTTNQALAGGVGVDAERNVYVACNFADTTLTLGSTTLTNSDPTATTPDVLTVKYNEFGVVQWAKSYGGAAVDLGSYIAVDATGTFYIAGRYSSATLNIGSNTLVDSAYGAPAGSSNYWQFYAKFDKMGSPIWAANCYDHVNIWEIKTDPAEHLYCAGSVDSTIVMGKDTLRVPGMQSSLIAKYDGAGTLLWASYGSGKNYALAYSMDIDTCGNVWVGGSTDSFIVLDGHVIPEAAVHGDRMYLAAYDHCGRYIPGTGTQLGSGGDDRLAVALDNRGHLYLGGDYAYVPLKLGADSLLEPPVTKEFFLLARYTYGSMPCDTARCCYVTPYANFTDTGTGAINFSYTGGATYDSLRWDFGDTTTANVPNPSHTFEPGTYHVCLIVFTSCGNDTLCKDVTVATTGITNISYEPEVSIYPNPSSGGYTIHSSTEFAAGTRAEIYDATGRRVASYMLKGNSTVISANGLVPGAYQCIITAPDNSMVKKQVVVK